MGSAKGSGVVNNGLGNSGGWGNGPAVLGLFLYAINQQETAMATATRARRAVMTRAIIKPILETQTSASAAMTEESVRGSALRFSRVKMALDWTWRRKSI